MVRWMSATGQANAESDRRQVGRVKKKKEEDDEGEDEEDDPCQNEPGELEDVSGAGALYRVRWSVD